MHQEDADEDTTHAKKPIRGKEDRVIKNVLGVVDLNRQLDVKRAKRAKVGNAQNKQRPVTGDGAKGLQQSRFCAASTGFTST